MTDIRPGTAGTGHLGYDELHVATMGPHHAEMIEFYGKEILPALT